MLVQKIMIYMFDTNTTVLGVLGGTKLKILVTHVEAGIRKERKDM
jgi:UDP-N-acetylglucosamine 2-epimerase